MVEPFFRNEVLMTESSTSNHNSHKKIQQDATVYQNFISDLYEAQHVSARNMLSFI